MYDNVNGNIENRKAIMIKEKKEKIVAIKQKYDNMQMSDKNAEKLYYLEIANRILKTATSLTKIVAMVKVFIPDPIPFIDEILMGSVPVLLNSVSGIVENKIDALANGQDANLKMEEVTKLSNSINNVLNSYNSINRASAR